MIRGSSRSPQPWPKRRRGNKWLRVQVVVGTFIATATIAIARGAPTHERHREPPRSPAWSTAPRSRPPGTYAIDASHSHAGFVVRHLMVSKVRGAFSGVSGTVDRRRRRRRLDRRGRDRPDHRSTPGTPVGTSTCAPTTSSAPRSTRPSPTAAPASARTVPTGCWTATSPSRASPTPSASTSSSSAPSPTPGAAPAWGSRPSGELDREDWGITWNQALETGGVVVGKKATLEIEAELVKRVDVPRTDPAVRSTPSERAAGSRLGTWRRVDAGQRRGHPPGLAEPARPRLLRRHGLRHAEPRPLRRRAGHPLHPARHRLAAVHARPPRHPLRGARLPLEAVGLDRAVGAAGHRRPAGGRGHHDAGVGPPPPVRDRRRELPHRLLRLGLRAGPRGRPVADPPRPQLRRQPGPARALVRRAPVRSPGRPRPGLRPVPDLVPGRGGLPRAPGHGRRGRLAADGPVPPRPLAPLRRRVRPPRALRRGPAAGRTPTTTSPGRGSASIWAPYAIGGVTKAAAQRAGGPPHPGQLRRQGVDDRPLVRPGARAPSTSGGLWDTTAVVVCTDHGHYLGDVRGGHDLWGKPGVPQYEPLGHTPLLVHWPGRPGGGTCDAPDHQRRPPRHAQRRLRRDRRRTAPTAAPSCPLLTGEATSVRDWALGGVWGNWVQVTDGRRKYARAAVGDNVAAVDVVEPLVDHAPAPRRLRGPAPAGRPGGPRHHAGHGHPGHPPALHGGRPPALLGRRPARGPTPPLRRRPSTPTRPRTGSARPSRTSWPTSCAPRWSRSRPPTTSWSGWDWPEPQLARTVSM